MSAVSGMTLDQAKQFVIEKAEACMREGGSQIGIWTETGNHSVLVGLAQVGKPSVTVAIPRAEYCGLRVLRSLGVLDV